MERYEIDALSLYFDLEMSCSMSDYAVSLISYDALNCLYRIFRCDDLWKVVSVTALAPILMTISGSKFSPSAREIHLIAKRREASLKVASPPIPL